MKETLGHSVDYDNLSIVVVPSPTEMLATGDLYDRSKSDTTPSVRDVISVNSVRLTRPRHAPDGAVRDFEAEIEGTVESAGESCVIGRISGCMSWLAWLPELIDEGRISDSFAELIAAALDTGGLVSAGSDTAIQTVLMIDRVWLEPRWRGSLFGRRIADQLIDLLLFTPESTLVLAYFEPDPDAPGRFWPRLEDDPATAAADHGEDRFDFERWGTSNTWLLRPRDPGPQTRGVHT